jgi:hypothetical protein
MRRNIGTEGTGQIHSHVELFRHSVNGRQKLAQLQLPRLGIRCAGVEDFVNRSWRTQVQPEPP